MTSSAQIGYMAIMLSAMIVGGVLLRTFQQKLPLTWWEKWTLGIGAFCGAMIGAKLPFALYHWEGLLSGTVWFAHGKTIIAGLLGGYFGVELAKWILHIRTKTGDSYVVPVAVSIAIGRWGCFVAGCCFGTTCEHAWGFEFPLAPDAGTILRHPTQVYESIFHLACAVVFLGLWRAGMWKGQLFKLYLTTYLLYRFFTEWIRPEPEWVLGLTAYQWASLAAVVVMLLLMWRDQRDSKSETQATNSLE